MPSDRSGWRSSRSFFGSSACSPCFLSRLTPLGLPLCSYDEIPLDAPASSGPGLSCQPFDAVVSHLHVACWFCRTGSRGTYVPSVASGDIWLPFDLPLPSQPIKPAPLYSTHGRSPEVRTSVYLDLRASLPASILVVPSTVGFVPKSVPESWGLRFIKLGAERVVYLGPELEVRTWETANYHVVVSARGGVSVAALSASSKTIDIAPRSNTAIRLSPAGLGSDRCEKAGPIPSSVDIRGVCSRASSK